MSDKNIEPKGSFWTTAPSCITAIGGLVSVVVAAVVALSAAGFIKPPFAATATPPAVSIAAPASNSNSVVESAPVATNTDQPPVISTIVLPTSTLVQVPQPPSVSSSINWAIDSTGACRDNIGSYPSWDTNTTGHFRNARKPVKTTLIVRGLQCQKIGITVSL